MQPQAWDIEIFDRFGGVESSEQIADAAHQIRSQQFSIIVFEEAFESLVIEVRYHTQCNMSYDWLQLECVRGRVAECHVKQTYIRGMRVFGPTP